MSDSEMALCVCVLGWDTDFLCTRALSLGGTIHNRNMVDLSIILMTFQQRKVKSPMQSKPVYYDDK